MNLFETIRRGQTKTVYYNASATSITVNNLSLTFNVVSNSVEVTASPAVRCGAYNFTIDVVDSSGAYTILACVFVVGDYRVEQHVFKNQSVAGFLNDESRALNDVMLSIYVCEQTDVISAIYRRYEYEDEKGGQLEAINECPRIEFESDFQNGVKHQRASVVLSSSFPLAKVFERYFELQSLPFEDKSKTDSLFAFLRITKSNGDVICEGIIDTQDGRLQYQFANTKQPARRIERVSGNVEDFTYTISQSITLEVYHASTILSVLPVVDNETREISYTFSPRKSSGKGFIDFIFNTIPTTSFTSIATLIDVFARYFAASVLAECGIYMGEGYTFIQGYKSFCAVVAEFNTSSPYDYTPRFVDVVDLLVEAKRFIQTDAFGTGTMFNGEKQSLNIELTRGLKGSDGKFPNRDKELEFSFFQNDTAQDVLNVLTEAMHLIPSFETRRTSTNALEHTYVIDVRLCRPFFTSVVYEFNRLNYQFVQITTPNEVEIISTNQTLNQNNVAEIDDTALILRQLDQITPIEISAREVFGAGNEWNGETINDNFHKRIEAVLTERNPVRAVSSRVQKKSYELTFATKRWTTKYYTSYRVASNSLNQLVGLSNNTITIYPLFFAVNFTDKPRIHDFFAEAFVDFARLVESAVRREVYEQVQFNNIETLNINQGTLIKTDLINQATEQYIIRSATIDHVGKSVMLKLEKLRAPFDKVANENNNIKVIHEEAKNSTSTEPFLNFQRWGVRRYRRPFTLNTLSLPFAATELDDDFGVFFSYQSGTNIFNNAYEGVDVLLPANAGVVIFRDDVKFFSGSTSSIPTLISSILTPVDYLQLPGRLTIQARTLTGTFHARFDVIKGCLLSRARRAYMKFTKMADGQVTPNPFVSTSSHDHYIRLGFAYRGDVRLIRLSSGASRIIDVFAKADGIYITHIFQSGSFKIDLPATRNKVFDLFLRFQYTASPPSLTVYAELDRVSVSVLPDTKSYNDLRFAFEGSLSPLPTLTAMTGDKDSFVALTYAKAVEVTYPTPSTQNVRALFDLGFDDIFAPNGNERYSTQATQTEFVVDINPSASTPNFQLEPNLSPFISIRPVETIKYLQL